MVKFCQKCKGLIVPKKVSLKEKGEVTTKLVNVCIRCNTTYETLEKDTYKFKKKFDHTKDVSIVIDNTNVETDSLNQYKEFELEKPEEEEY